MRGDRDEDPDGSLLMLDPDEDLEANRAPSAHKQERSEGRLYKIDVYINK